MITKEEINKKIEQYVDIILIFFAEQIVEDLERQRKEFSTHAPVIYVDKFLPFLRKAIEKAKEEKRSEL